MEARSTTGEGPKEEAEEKEIQSIGKIREEFESAMKRVSTMEQIVSSIYQQYEQKNS